LLIIKKGKKKKIGVNYRFSPWSLCYMGLFGLTLFLLKLKTL